MQHIDRARPAHQHATQRQALEMQGNFTCTHHQLPSAACDMRTHLSQTPSLLTLMQSFLLQVYFGGGATDTSTPQAWHVCHAQAVWVGAARTHRDFKRGGFVLHSLLHRAVWQGNLDGVIGQLCLFSIVAFLDLLEQLLTA